MTSSEMEWEVVGNKAKKILKNNAKLSNSSQKSYVPKYQDVVQLSSGVYLEESDDHCDVSNGRSSGDYIKSNNNKRNRHKGSTTQTSVKEDSIEHIFGSISNSALRKWIQKLKSNYPSNQAIWLRDTASYLEISFTQITDMNVDKFSKCLNSYPMTFITKDVRKSIVCLLDEVSESIRQVAFEGLIVNASNLLARDLPVYGHMLMIQIMADHCPALCLSCTSRVNDLLKSYQNRSLVGQALLWCVGQAGRQDIKLGLRVWTDCFLPLISFRNYGKFVVDYVEELLELHAKRKHTSAKRCLYPRHFFAMFDTIFHVKSNSVSMKNDLRLRMLRLYPVLKEISIQDDEGDYEVFAELLTRLECSMERADLKNELVDCLLYSLTQNLQISLFHWSRMYTSHLQSSCWLLEAINERWTSLAPSLVKRSSDSTGGPDFPGTIEAFSEFNESCTKETARRCQISCENILPKATSCSKSVSVSVRNTRSCLPSLMVVCFFLWSFFLIRNDLNAHGGRLEFSNIGRFMKDAGVLGLVQNSIEWSSDQWKAYDGPILYNKYVDPSVQVATDLVYRAKMSTSKIVGNTISMVEERFPGTNDAFGNLKTNSINLGKQVWLKIGSLSRGIRQNKIFKDVSKWSKKMSTGIIKRAVVFFNSAKGYSIEATVSANESARYYFEKARPIIEEMAANIYQMTSDSFVAVVKATKQGVETATAATKQFAFRITSSDAFKTVEKEILSLLAIYF